MAETPPLLLDTHALLWWLDDHPRLSAPAREAIADGARRVLVSAASLWEIATKHRLGKLGEAEAFLSDPAGVLRAEGFEPLAVTWPHALLAGRLDTPHRDPFDRMLAAQAMLDGLVLVSGDRVLDAMGEGGRSVERLW
jgi:PIN domain nuclease of toxin-antitoxin system